MTKHKNWGGMIVSDLCTEMRIRVEKTQTCTEERKRSNIYIFYLNGVWVLDINFCLRPVTFGGPAW